MFPFSRASQRRKGPHPDQLSLFGPADVPETGTPRYDEKEAYRRVKQTGEVAQGLRDRLFVDRPVTARGWELQARRLKHATQLYEHAWREAIAHGFGEYVVARLGRDWERKTKVVSLPVKM